MKRADLGGTDGLIAFAAAFDRDDAQISSLVRQALQDPQLYVRTHRKVLGLRGVSEPVPTLPWLALVDALIDASFAVELDWREALSVALAQVFALRVVPTGERVSEIPGPDFDLDANWTLIEAIRSAAGALATVGIDVLVLDLHTDSYAILCSQRSMTAEVEALAIGAGASLVRGTALGDR